MIAFGKSYAYLVQGRKVDEILQFLYKEHECDMLMVVLASLTMSPIGGLLYVLCFPYKRR